MEVESTPRSRYCFYRTVTAVSTKLLLLLLFHHVVAALLLSRRHY